MFFKRRTLLKGKSLGIRVCCKVEGLQSLPELKPVGFVRDINLDLKSHSDSLVLVHPPGQGLGQSQYNWDKKKVGCFFTGEKGEQRNVPLRPSLALNCPPIPHGLKFWGLPLFGRANKENQMAGKTREGALVVSHPQGLVFPNHLYPRWNASPSPSPSKRRLESFPLIPPQQIRRVFLEAGEVKGGWATPWLWHRLWIWIRTQAASLTMGPPSLSEPSFS